MRLLLGLLGAAHWAVPGLAAEYLLVGFGPLERSIAIADLEHFATTGELTPQLRIYTQQLGLSADQLSQVRQVLSTPATLSAVAVSQFLYTEQGVLLLEQISRVVQTPVRQANVQALRGALILAAADPDDGLTLLNVLRRYPTGAMRIDLGQGLAIAQEVNQAILQSEAAFAQVRALAQGQAAATPVDFGDLLQRVEQERQYTVERVQVIVPNLPQPVQLFLPRSQPGGQPRPARGFPVVVISHGLGGTAESYAYLAEYLASGGLAVVALEHFGSNDQQLYALLTGLSGEVVQTQEFVRRPREVSRTLDTLSQLNRTPSPLRGQLDLSQVGVLGQSFGGYTALALAGAGFNGEGLAATCPPSTLSFNPSLLLQCQALSLGNSDDRLGDDRVKAIFVMNPVGSVLFGPEGYGQIQTSVLVVGGTADTVAPAYPEQIVPFDWLTAANRYLLLISGGTHFSVIGDVGGGDQPLIIPPAIIGPRPELVQDYMQVLGLAYFKFALEGDERFQPLLSAAFAAALSQPDYPLSLVNPAASAQLETPPPTDGPPADGPPENGEQNTPLDPVSP